MSINLIDQQASKI